MKTDVENLPKTIDTLYKSTKQIPWAILMFIFMPFMIVIVSPVSLYYWLQKNRLIKMIDQNKIVLENQSDCELSPQGECTTDWQKIEYLRDHKYDLLAPILFSLIIVFTVPLGIFFLQ